MPKNLNVSLLCDFYGDLLTTKQRQAILLYYNEDLSLAEIADELSITRQGARDNICRGEEKLEGYEKKLGLANKSSQLQKVAADMQEIIGLMGKSNSKNKDRLEELQNLIENMKSIL